MPLIWRGGGGGSTIKKDEVGCVEGNESFLGPQLLGEHNVLL